ncbi:MAG TPA: hypothetical protein VK166_14765 [Chitinophagaceae bacterium]|nr:hypothetical protein [Chitinophagaceae bacterium]
MDVAKLALSEEELRLVMDPGIILTKNAIIAKVYDLFGELADQMRKDLILPAEVATISPKISKGESYQGLPYVMLDYPRYFTADHVLALRTFFWWGNFFSVNLHLKGKYQELYRSTLVRHFELLASKEYAIAVSADEWQHHTGSDEFRQLITMDENEFADLVSSHPFIKLSRSFSLDQWHNMDILLQGSQLELGSIIGLITT